MNTEIIKELARTWRAKAEPRPCEVEEAPMKIADTIKVSVMEKKIDEAVQETLKHCAKDLEDVVKIFNEFKHWAK